MTTPNVRFKKGINQITGKTSEGKALPALKAFFREWIRRKWRAKCLAFDDADVERELQEVLENRRENGFEPGEVEKFKHLYSTLPRRGPRKKS